MTKNLATGGGGGENSGESDDWSRARYGGSEIEEEFSIDISSNRLQMSNLDTIKEEMEGSLFSFDFHGGSGGGGGGGDCVYVAVWKQNEEASMDALIWAMKNTVFSSSTVVFLIHVFPETKFIPSPLGKLAVSQVNPEQKENYMAQERGKRSEFLQKFLNIRPTSNFQIKMDTILIESDMEAKAILDLIHILYIKKLVLGANKSNEDQVGEG
ncbi:uncharacterized protein [Henckelia pumila]|uniref:uncharacterized protein isoform X2 n=1 Tax=Henckelia pumila TaxID=405737 RepID=UPI003C6DDC4C